jgi:hypothetical protein
MEASKELCSSGSKRKDFDLVKITYEIKKDKIFIEKETSHRDLVGELS